MSVLETILIVGAILLINNVAEPPRELCPIPVAIATGCPEANGEIAGGEAVISASEGNGGAGTAPQDRPGLSPAEKSALVRAYIRAQQEWAEANGYGAAREDFVSSTVALPEITLNDIASFQPSIGSQYMEPDGWMVTGLDTNFYSDAAASAVAGVLLEYPVTVRFTPKAWRWNYGDGSSRTSATPGASWAALGAQEFDATSTSHVFAAPGNYTIALSVGFSAEYQFAGLGWRPIAGTLWAPAPPLAATAGDATTVLVARDCLANPGGPGC
jgi:hypothetical protein